MELKAMDMRAYKEMKGVMGEVLKELIETFIDYMPGQLDDLNDAINKGDADLVFGIAHRIKSSSNSIGALGLAETAETIELIGRSGKTKGTDTHFTMLNDQLNEVMTFLKQELESLNA
jgi:HPt (histidine-containing phosphotransfer) domain-containing protein